MGNGKGGDVGYPLNLAQDCFCVGKIWTIRKQRQSIATYNAVQFLMDFLHYFGMVQHVGYSVAQSIASCFRSSLKQIQAQAEELLICK